MSTICNNKCAGQLATAGIIMGMNMSIMERNLPYSSQSSAKCCFEKKPDAFESNLKFYWIMTRDAIVPAGILTVMKKIIEDWTTAQVHCIAC